MEVRRRTGQQQDGSAGGQGPGECRRDGQTRSEEGCRRGGHGVSAKVGEGKGRV